MAKVHCIIPDAQVKEGTPLEHLEWAGRYIAEKKPDVIVCLGDFADMPSLSSYDVGKKSFEGRTYKADVEAVKVGLHALLTPINGEIFRVAKNKKKGWYPRKVMTLGNHEERINTAINLDRKLDGLISVGDLKYEEWGWEVHPFKEVVTIDGVCYCLAKHHKVLTKDLRYIPLSDVCVGMELVGFDEEKEGDNNHRKYKTAVVTKHSLSKAKTYKVVLSDSKVFEVTLDHRWLVRKEKSSEYCWKHTYELKAGDRVPRIQKEWGEEVSKKSGWISGIMDGEGWLSKPNTKQGGIQLGVAQNEGVVLDKIKMSLTDYEIPYNVFKQAGNECFAVRLLGSSQQKVKFLGMFRPERLLQKFYPEMLGRVQSEEDVSIVSIEEYIEQDIVQIETSTKTLIVEGYGHHNCHYFTSGVMGRPVSSAKALTSSKHQSCVMGHVQKTEIDMSQFRADGTHIISLFAGCFYQHEEEYLGPQGNVHHRGIWMLYEVENGSFWPHFISMSYLKERYGS